jgi:adenylate kinase family enzyme
MVIVGATGAGKSMLARRLGEGPETELDALHLRSPRAAARGSR